MPKNFNDGVTAALTAALAALPTAGKLYIWLSDHAEADVDPTDTIAGGAPARTAGTAVKNVTGLTAALRAVDLLAADLAWTEEGASVQPKSVVVSTKDPSVTADATNKLWLIQDLNSGAAWDTTVSGPVIMPAHGLTVFNYYDGEV